MEGTTPFYRGPVSYRRRSPHRRGAHTPDPYWEWLTEGAYPQWIHYQLRSTCAGPLCIIFSNETGRIRSNNGLGYSRVANVTYTEDCESSGNRKYSQIVWPAGKGVEFGPVVDRDEPIVGCDLNA